MKKIILIAAFLSVFLLSAAKTTATIATLPVGIGQFSFPDKLYGFDENIPLSFNVFNYSRDGKKHNEKITFSLQPWKKINPNSQIDGVEIFLNNELLIFSEQNDLVKNFSLTDRETKPIKLNVFVKKDGEYMFSIRHSEYNAQTYFIITKDEKVCVGGGGWDSCVWNFLMDENKLPLDLAKDQLPFFVKDKIVNEYRETIHERRIKGELYDKGIVAKDDVGGNGKTIATPLIDGDQPVKKSFIARVWSWFIGLFR